MAFTRVARRGEIAESSGRIIEVGPGRFIALFNVGGDFYALDNECPHEGGPLGEGEVELATGNCVNARIKVARFAVRVEGDEVMVDL